MVDFFPSPENAKAVERLTIKLVFSRYWLRAGRCGAIRERPQDQPRGERRRGMLRTSGTQTDSESALLLVQTRSISLPGSRHACRNVGNARLPRWRLCLVFLAFRSFAFAALGGTSMGQEYFYDLVMISPVCRSFRASRTVL